jgi:CRISPR/Cas system-associated exonuclease Cas4 (RecB family)
MMKPFLVDVAETIIRENPRLEDATIVFPNKRAVMYFRHYLTEKISNPAWAPQLFSIEDWMSGLSEIKQLDKLDLIYRLYRVHVETLGTTEPFEQFYFWGDMLLQDFEEIDKYLVNPEHIFRDLRNMKVLDATFDYLTVEQKEFLSRFWIGFDQSHSNNKDQFINLWKKLGKLYEKFTGSLKKEKLGHGGMIFRDVADRVKSGKFKFGKFGKVYFAGFNALTNAEEVVMTHFVENGASIFWDADSYYENDTNQEAGTFFRQYRQHPVLGRTMPAVFPSDIKAQKKIITETSVPNRIGQAKLMVQDLKTVPIESNLEKGGNTVIVLADESMLLPVLHSLPNDLASINVTMGFPLRNTSMFNLLDNILDLQTSRRSDYFNHAKVTAILSHSHVLEMTGNQAKVLRQEFIDRNRVLIKAEEFAGHPFLKSVFRPIETSQTPEYLLEIVHELGAAFKEDNKLGKEYAFHFYRILSKLKDVMDESATSASDNKIPHKERMKAFQKLFRQVVQSVKIPFVGEPLKGVQVMGILETRNLDFENVFILNLNEGSWPAQSRQSSYIPFSLRKAYGLPTFDHTDSIYAYLFYRLFQRSSNVFLYYNSEPDVLGSSEMSRFLRQLNIELELPIQKRILSNKIQLKGGGAISYTQNEASTNFLQQFIDGEKPLSPTTLNDYIECRLRFYLKHVAGYREADEIEEGLDARVFGNMLHNVLFWVYEDLKTKKGSSMVEYSDFAGMRDVLPALLDRAFRKQYDLPLERPVDYDGPWLVMKEIIFDFALAVLQKDEAAAPLDIISLEEKWGVPLQIKVGGEMKSILIGGKIDRVDSGKTGVRIIDYKTGKDDVSFNSIESLFARQGKRNKAAFQTLYYSLVFRKKNPTYIGPIRPGLYNKYALFKSINSFGLSMNSKLIDANELLSEFEVRLSEVLTELYSPMNEFVQTENKKNCEYCSFKNLCRR